MKQKKIGTDLYVFDTSAYQLTKDLDAENIYIQQELIPGYLAVNSSTGVQAKIKPYNYKLNIIQKPVWGDYIYADEPEPEKQDLVCNLYENGNLVDSSVFIVNSNTVYLENIYGANIISVKDSDGNEIPVVLTSSDTSIFEIDQDSADEHIISAKDFGTATLTAEWAETDEYNAGSLTQTIKVSPVIRSGSESSTYLEGTQAYLHGQDSIFIEGLGVESIPINATSDTLQIDENSGTILINGTSGQTGVLNVTWADGEGYSAGSGTWNVTLI